jgi:hypothetical protein
MQQPRAPGVVVCVFELYNKTELFTRECVFELYNKTELFTRECVFEFQYPFLSNTATTL